MSGQPPSSSAGASDPLPPDWERAWDSTHGTWYWFNRRLNISQWHAPAQPSTSANGNDTHAAHASSSATALGVQPPVASTTKLAPVPLAAQGSAAVNAEAKPRPGLYYFDPYARLQGPFTQEHIQGWRPYLPMDLPVWVLDEEDFAKVADQQAADEGMSQQGTRAEAQQGEGGVQGAVDKPGVGANEREGDRDGGEGEGAPSKRQRVSAGDGGAGLSDAAQADAAAATEQQATASQAADGTARIQEAVAGATSSTGGGTGAGAGSETAAAAGCGTEGGTARWYTVEELMAVMPHVELADLVGDTVLLADWRAHQGQAQQAQQAQQQEHAQRRRPVAPPAPIWEHWMLYGPRAQQGQQQTAGAPGQQHQYHQQQQQHGGAGPPELGEEVDEPGPDGSNSRLSYAEAVLAGLPPDDEAVVISQLALSAGKTLQDVVDFSYAHDRSGLAGPAAKPAIDYTAAMRDPHSGRLTAVGIAEQGATHASTLYGEMSRWVNPEELERSLQEAARRRGQQLPPHIWKKLKERKLEIKKKMKVAAMQ